MSTANNTVFYDWRHTPYGSSSLTYPGKVILDGCVYNIGESSEFNSRALEIIDIEGDLVTYLILDEPGEYWHTVNERVHVNEFSTLLEAIVWAISVETNY